MATIGVKIELEGAQEYKQNMSSITAQTKLYQAQMKSLNGAMGSQLSAFQKSIQMTKTLEQQLQAQNAKRDLLTQKINESIEKYGEESTQVLKLQTQLQNLDNEIAKTQKQIDDLGGTWGAVGAQIEEVSNKLSSVGGKISSVGEGLSKTITAPIVGIGTASVVAFKEVDEGLDTIAVKTGASGKALEEMEDIAKSIATTIPASFDEAGNAVGEVNTRFGLTGDALDDLSTKFIEFSQLNGTGVSESIDSVQAAMAAFGLEASDASMVLDVLNKAGQDSGISISQLSNSLLSNASALTEMGWNINSSAGFIANLEKNGIDASTAMAGLKKAFQNAANDGVSMEDAMKNLQDTMANASSDTESYQAAIELFGAKAGPAIAKAVNEGRISFDEAANSIKGYSDSVSSTFEQTQDPIDQFQTNMNKLKLVGADLVNTAAPLITEVMEKMSAVIQKVSDAWNGLSEDTQQQIINVALIAAAIGPILVAVGKVVSALGTIGSAIGKLVTFAPTIIGAISTVGGILTSTVIPAIVGVVTALAPFLPIIAAVAAAIAAVIIVVKNWGAITDFLTEKWQAFTEWISGALDNLVTYFQTHFGFLGDLIAAVIEGIRANIMSKIEIIKAVITAFGEIINAITTGDWTKVKETIQTLWTAIVTRIQSKIQNVVNAVKNMGTTIKNTLTNLLNSAKEWGSHFVQNFCDGITAKMSALIDKVRSMADTVRSYLHFSTGPDVGPLKDFNSWPRHMVQNYAEGISAAQFLVKDAVSDIAADVQVLQNPFDYAAMYEAVRSGASNANVSLSIGEREFARTLREMGVAF